MEKVITKKYIFFTIIAGILTIIPISPIIYNIIGVTDELLYLISYYATKVIGLLIYICILKDLNKRRNIYLFISFISLLISLFLMNSLDNIDGGLDALGEAIITGFLFNASIIIYHIMAFITFLSYAKKFIFNKKIIIGSSIFLLLVISIFIAKLSFNTKKINKSELPTVRKFEKELLSRNLCEGRCNTSSETKLYGIKNGLKKADELSFTSNSSKKYPMYVYASIEKENENNWIMYYIDGNLYAVNGFYYVSKASKNFNEERKVIIDFPDIIVSEKEEIITYNPQKNVFKKSKSLSTSSLNYYPKDGEIGIYVDYLDVSKYNFFDIKVVNKIDKNTLDQISQDTRKDYKHEKE